MHISLNLDENGANTMHYRKCLPLKHIPVIYTDLDHTIIGDDGDVNGVPQLISKLELFRINIIPLTAKSIFEIIHLRNKRLPIGINTPLIIIAESGAAVYAEREILPYSDGITRFEDIELEYVKLYRGRSPLHEYNLINNLINKIKCENKPIPINDLSIETLKKLTKLPPDEASLIPVREHMLIYYIPDTQCKIKIAQELRKYGYYTGIGKNFLHIGKHKGKEHALVWAHNNIPLLKGRPTIGLGDSEPDKNFLEIVDYPVLIPHKTSIKIKLQSTNYLVPPYPAPKGWVYAVKTLLNNINYFSNIICI